MASGDSRVIHLSPAAEADRLIMVVIADPQLGMKGGASDWREDITTFDRVIKAVNILHPRPHFCVVVGDFVHHHPSIYPEMENCASVFERQLNDFQSCVAQLHESIPVFFCPGNHDVGNSPTPETLEVYQGRFGPSYYAIDINARMSAIVLNSCLFSGGKYAEDQALQQVAWLDDILQDNATKYNIVMQHHPMYLDAEEEPDDLPSRSHYQGHIVPDAYFHVPKEKRMPLLQMLRKGNVRAIFAGHYHKCRHKIQGNPHIEMITTGAVNEPLGDVLPSGQCVNPVDRPGFRVVMISGASSTQNDLPVLRTKYITIESLSHDSHALELRSIFD